MNRRRSHRIRMRYLFRLFLLALAACLAGGCGGGGGGSDGSGGSGNNISPPTSWTDTVIKHIPGGGLLIPQVKAVMGSGDRIHFAYFTDSETTDGYFTVNHLLWDSGTGDELSHEEVVDVDNCRTLDLVTGPDGAPVVAYQGGEIREGGSEQQSDVMISVFSDNAWHEYTGGIGFVERNPIFTDGLAGKHVSMAVDPDGDFHLAYQFFYEGIDAMNFDYPDLFFVEKDGASLSGDGTEETVEGNVYNDNGTASVQNRVGAYADLLIDNDGNPVVIYYADLDPNSSDRDTKGLRIAYRQGDTWECEWIENGFEVGGISAALDPDGNVCVAYYVATEYTDALATHEKCLKYARKSGAAWVKTLVDETSQCGEYPSLAFSPTGRPSIAYYAVQNHSGSVILKDLKLARYNGSTWDRQTVCSTGDIGKFNTLWFDAGGTICISTYSATDSSIHLFTW
jgi:hypothetical protein